MGIVEQIIESGIKGPLTVFIISMLPISELRGAIPIAIHTFKIPVVQSYIISVIGNLIPPPFILLCLGPFSTFLSRWQAPKNFFDWLFSHTRSRSAIIERYKILGLILFVAIPLPVTGAWTGSIAAFLFGMSLGHAMLGVVSGVLIAGVIVTLVSCLSKIGIAIGIAILLSIALTGFLLQKKGS